ncbi:sugar-binding protein [Pseudonocardia nigra]|uniref:sugar-binding protein n=1 Tax=Pseudonocardia nigra TaxID=1921578 RepID=UPI001C5EEEF8|nr:sugar-binding protein [Pseudonocardia nigra]
MRSALLVAGVLAAGLVVGSPGGPPTDSTSAGPPVDLDVLFIGAHPDDEASTLSTLGQWKQTLGARSGVVTITRGEGGGNAVGPEEGPALGLLREDEERRAVGTAGVTDVYNLDEVDFYYTVSAPLTQQVWGDDVLERVVRIVRQTRPEVLLTMNPAPSPGNHGHHQEAARLAIAAYYAAADPKAFPSQITQEGLEPFAAAKILRNGAAGEGPTGPDCAATLVPADPTQDVFGVWSGAQAPDGRSWAAVERDAQRVYASQGWAVFPDVPTDPAELGCDRFTQIDSRVPYPAPGTPEAASPTAILTGADGPRLEIEAPFDVSAGEPFPVTVRADGADAGGTTLTAPDGWAVSATDAAGGTFTVTPPADAAPGTRVRLEATTAAGYTAEQVEVAPPVRVAQEPLPQVAEFTAWADELEVAQLRGVVTPVLTLPSGGSREIPMTVTNLSDAPQSGTVAVELPAGFTTDAASKPFADLAPGASTTVPFVITNTDPALPTSTQGGDHAYTLSVATAAGTTSVQPALELVPATEVPAVDAAPVIDGVGAAAEYPGPVLDLSRRWEGDDCESAEDCSATARLSRSGDVLNVLVEVTDSVGGTALAATDCKRHWRTDSVELALDPAGTSENTATTFKLAVLPWTADRAPCASRDADNHQGPAAETAPGVQYATTVTGTGYTVEAAIPLAALPAPVDPERLGLNLFVYDSDTQDQTGQTRIGWSTWQGVQGDPYRWGRATLPGYEPAGGEVSEPAIPSDALLSSQSPQSIEQAVDIDVPLSGGPAAPADASGWLTGARPGDGAVEVTATSTSAGSLSVFVMDAEGIAGSLVVPVDGAGEHALTVPLDRPLGADARAVAAWTVESGSLASRVPVG